MTWIGERNEDLSELALKGEGSCWTLNQRVTGSSPVTPTKQIKRLGLSRLVAPAKRHRLIPTNAPLAPVRSGRAGRRG